jgi:hypothetical protein
LSSHNGLVSLLACSASFLSDTSARKNSNPRSEKTPKISHKMDLPQKALASLREFFDRFSRTNRSNNSDSGASSPLLPPPVPVKPIAPHLLPISVPVPVLATAIRTPRQAPAPPVQAPPPTPPQPTRSPPPVPQGPGVLRLPVALIQRERVPPPPLPDFKFPNPADDPEPSKKMLIK